MTHIFAPLIDRAQRNSDDVFCYFIKDGAVELVTAGDMLRRALRIAAGLQGLVREPGGIVPIVLPHSADLYAAFIGTSLAGLCPSFLSPMTFKQDPTVFRHSMAALLNRIQPAAMVIASTTREDVPTGRWPVLDVSDLRPADDFNPQLDLAQPADNTAFLQHSSGTTGLKKGVMLSHGVVLDHVSRYAKAVALDRSDCIVSWLPLYHDMGLITAFLMPAVIGCPIVSFDALEWVIRPTLLLDYLEQFGGTACWLPNFAFHHIVRLDPGDRQRDLTRLRLVVNCSEPCRIQAFRCFKDAYERFGLRPEALQVCYAMAETVFAVTQTRLNERVKEGSHPDYHGFLSSGRPIDNAEVTVVDEREVAVPNGALGQVRVKSSSLFDGYFRDPEKTAERCRNGWYYTGDIGFLDGDELVVVGRLDDIITVNGKNIVAHEVESELSMVEGLLPGRILVFGRYDPESGGNHLIVLAESRAAASEIPPIGAAIRRIVLAQCGLRPHSVRLLAPGFLIKSTSGKLSRPESIKKFLAPGAEGERRHAAL